MDFNYQEFVGKLQKLCINSGSHACYRPPKEELTNLLINNLNYIYVYGITSDSKYINLLLIHEL